MIVDVYKNLTRGTWSIRCAERGHPMRGKVIGHAESVSLDDCEMKVQQGGLARMRRENKRYVHAFIRGTLRNERQAASMGVAFTYLPWTHDTFTTRETGAPIHRASRVDFTKEHGCFASVDYS